MNKVELKKLFLDICRGYSFCPEIDFYVKHLSLEGEMECELAKEEATARARQNGLRDKEALVKEAISSGTWTEANENSLKIFARDYKRLNMSRFTPISEKQLVALRAELKLIEEEWIKLYNKKNNLLDESAEGVGERAFHDRMLLISLYKDRELKELAFDEESFDYMDDYSFGKISRMVACEMARFSHENMAQLSVESFFQQRFEASPNSYDFFGKPAHDMTDYQISLIKLGNKFKTILDEVGGQVEPEDSPDEIEDYFYLKRAGLIKSEMELAKEKSMWD